MPGAHDLRALNGEEEMAGVSHFFLRTLPGRIVLVALFLVVSLIIASLAGWLPVLD